MIIDFHTHVFPEKIAAKTIAYLSEKGGVPPFSDGTADGLLKRMEEAGVDISVTLPVLTSPTQFDSVNRFAVEINRRFENEKRRLISFAGIHPACEDIAGKMRFIKESGFLGVKIHPDYQGTFVDDAGYIEIVRRAKEHGLIVVTHAGYDFGYPDSPIRCTPDRLLRLLESVPYGKIVAAHYGGTDMHEEVLEKLCGQDIYFDTAYVLRFLGKEMFEKILKKHGKGKILFATDSPWSSVEGDVKIIKSFNLGTDAEDKIFSRNAMALLGL